MKSLMGIALSLCALTLAAGCSSTKITETHPMYGKEELPKPERIYVYPFATTQADLPAWSSAAKQHNPPGEPPSPEHLKVGRELGLTVAEELVSKIQQMGLTSLVASKQTTPRVNDLLIVGYFGTFDEGSRLKRMTLGFGSGSAEVTTAAEGYQWTANGPRQLGGGKVESGGNKMPGVALPIVVLAATANPIGLIVGGGMKVYGEMSGKDTIEGSGKRTGEAIAEHLEGKFKEQGGSINPSLNLAAEKFNEPGRFTAFIGYECTSNTGGNNLHRNVIFRDNGDKASQVEPFTVYPPMGSDNPEDLWKWMAAYEEKTVGSVLAIAHNGNLSNGLMFPTIETFGKTIDRGYVETRAKWERLYEATQTKGDGEAHPLLSPNDEFADFETWDKGNLDGSVAKTKEMLEFEYARSGLKNGLMLEEKFGTNPFKFGLIGSSDADTGLSALEEENFFGKTTPQEPSPERMTKTFFDNPKTGVKVMDWEVSASGYAGVWATENTREALWDTMERKETYGTTGPRMIVRFFGGWEFEPDDAHNRLPAAIGYTKGVPMGGDLTDAPAGKSPRFLVAALKDVMGANLDRIQIIKGWLGKDGALHEKVYDVVWGDADKRQPGSDGKLTPVGSTVDLENATWTNTIGDPELITVWTDPDFDQSVRAFYYARVLEIPTPRWTAYDAKRFGVNPLPETRMVLQERAYTSPIWYNPET